MKAFETFKSIKPRKLNNLIILFITGLAFWISITTLLPTLPIYIEDIGATTQEVGLVMGAFAIGLLASRAWLGQLTDRRSRKLVIIIGTVVAAIAPLGYLLAHEILPLIVIRAFHGISIAAFTTGYSALVVDLSPSKQRGELIGYMSLVVPIGMSMGPALGGFLQESFGYSPLFLVSSGCGFLAFLLASQVQEERVTFLNLETSKTQILENRSFWQIFRSPSFLVLTAILLLAGLLFGTLVSFLPLFMREIKLPLSAGLFYTAAAIASFIGRLFTGRASDYYGRGLFITISLILYGLSMLLIALAETPSAFLLAAVFEGAGGGILIPMVLTLISDRSYGNERGQVFAICIGGFDLGIALAGPIFGGLSPVLGYRGMFFLAASLAIVALLLFFSQSNKSFYHSLRFALGKGKDFYALDQG